ncbi:MAG: 4-hydroxy-3-methylbut-2-enyl diphosphate reductase [Odoribacteraceae bacterium]|jgi:4-hydroxy-3-methylbut-2-enyl diphosphate reductase|nr:4-hydroxy-3-methylbut-2-enyl diphosphate reductase [Odoribacteraceae bacterium]
MRVEIDENSGFCFGVVNAIRKAEEELRRGPLYCIGEIVHNDVEVRRLARRGLRTIDHETFAGLHRCRVLFRAHGEPPSSYALAARNEVEVIDASCPVVLALQRKIREAHARARAAGGQVVIYGKPGHAEVTALLAQTGGEAIVAGGVEDLDAVDFSRPVTLFSQTTQGLEGFREIVARARERAGATVSVHDTICRKVANRVPQLKRFAASHDAILFVSDEKSSNGKLLFSVCREVNPRSYFIQDARDLRREMLDGVDSAGISGATSTPRRVMESVGERVRALAGEEGERNHSKTTARRDVPASQLTRTTCQRSKELEY